MIHNVYTYITHCIKDANVYAKKLMVCLKVYYILLHLMGKKNLKFIVFFSCSSVENIFNFYHNSKIWNNFKTKNKNLFVFFCMFFDFYPKYK